MKYDYSDALKKEMRKTRRKAHLEQVRQWYEALRPALELILGLIVITLLAAMFAYCLLMWFTEPSLNGTY